MTTFLQRLPRAGRLGVLAVAVCLVAGTITALATGPRERTATAYFVRATGLYEGDDVVVLGVPVGKVTDIVPERDSVRVRFTYTLDRPLPADVKAAIMSPSLVPVRELRLAPLYTGGPRLPDDATIPLSRTAVPVEWDEVKEQVTRLSRLLGPHGANSRGALTRLLDTSAANLHGQGVTVNQTIRTLARAMETLSGSRDDAFATVRNLRVFVDALAMSDLQVLEFNRRLATTAEVLGDSSDDLGAALTSMNHAFGDVQRFLREHRGEIRGTVRDLRPIADILARNRQDLADLLHIAPVATSNLYNIYEPMDGSITGAFVGPQRFLAPAEWICSSIYAAGGTPTDCSKAIGPLADLATVAPPPVGASLVERNGRENQVRARRGPEPDGRDR
jgi:phospholipid/cholesterol/gamma-HCH transport system substrate-binding protein